MYRFVGTTSHHHGGDNLKPPPPACQGQKMSPTASAIVSPKMVMFNPYKKRNPPVLDDAAPSSHTAICMKNPYAKEHPFPTAVPRTPPYAKLPPTMPHNPYASSSAAFMKTEYSSDVDSSIAKVSDHAELKATV